MQVTQEMLDRYAGGQIEVQNQGEQYLYRGEIATITIDREDIKVTLNWMAKGEGYPMLPRRWVSDDRREYEASTFIYTASLIGGGRLCLNSPYTGELVVLFPPDGSKLDPAKVEGLEITEPA